MTHRRLTRYRWHLLDAVQLVAIALLALALTPVLGHLLTLQSRLQMQPNDYFVVQQLDRSMLVVGVLGLLALGGVLVHAFLVRGNARAFAWSIVAACALSVAQVIFWSIAVPMGALTGAWTVASEDFESARQNWEYAIALAGVVTFGALMALARAIEASRPLASLAILESIERDAAVRLARRETRPLDGDTKLQRDAAA